MVSRAPGMYFLGLHFQSALSSGLIAGVGADANYIASHIERQGRRRTARAPKDRVEPQAVGERVP